MILTNNDSIHICLVLYDKSEKFSKVTATSIISVFEHTTSWVTVHLIHDNTLTTDNRNKFIQMARKYSQHITFYNIDELAPIEADLIKNNNNGRFSPGSMFRLLMSKVIPDNIKKIIYLDGDIIVNMDIAKMYAEPVGKNGIAAVPEYIATYNHMVNKKIINDGTVNKEDYFCAGTMIIDMDEMRKYPSICIDGIKFLNDNPEYDCIDQDIMNYYFSKEYYKLPVNYNIFVDAHRLPDINIWEITEGIYHYAGNAMDIAGVDDIYNQLFFDYYIKTPWFDGKIFLTAISETLKLKHKTSNAIMNLTYGKKIVFCGNIKNDVEMIKASAFSIPSTEMLNIIEDNGLINISNIIKYRNEHTENNILFAIIPMHPQISNILKKNNFKEGTDYINAELLLRHNAFNGRGLLKNI